MKKFTCLSSKLRTELTIPIAKSTSPSYGTRLSVHAIHIAIVRITYIRGFPYLQFSLLLLHSDLDPCHAPQWSVRAKMSDNPQCLLG